VDQVEMPENLRCSGKCAKNSGAKEKKTRNKWRGGKKKSEL